LKTINNTQLFTADTCAPWGC